MNDRSSATSVRRRDSIHGGITRSPRCDGERLDTGILGSEERPDVYLVIVRIELGHVGSRRGVTVVFIGDQQGDQMPLGQFQR